eukprot:3261078-Prymnesium_polylepis.1
MKPRPLRQSGRMGIFYVLAIFTPHARTPVAPQWLGYCERNTSDQCSHTCTVPAVVTGTFADEPQLCGGAPSGAAIMAAIMGSGMAGIGSMLGNPAAPLAMPKS